VIGDRITDVELAKNLGCKAIWMDEGTNLGGTETSVKHDELMQFVALRSLDWKEIYTYLRNLPRYTTILRRTSETDIRVHLNLDGSGHADIATGIGFFDHMLEQIARHGGMDLEIDCDGDLEIDEHHSIEDIGIALGEAFRTAMGKKIGMERYGFSLPMDEANASALLDFGGRTAFKWKVKLEREFLGDMPTEMFAHFFESFAQSAKCNLHLQAKGENEHHKIEAVFKAFARALKMAIARNVNSSDLPSTKGVL
jgi:imidazoleglycerol-phosphate dehydratase/histidinol-phosphatase